MLRWILKTYINLGQYEYEPAKQAVMSWRENSRTAEMVAQLTLFLVTCTANDTYVPYCSVRGVFRQRKTAPLPSANSSSSRRLEPAAANFYVRGLLSLSVRLDLACSEFAATFPDLCGGFGFVVRATSLIFVWRGNRVSWGTLVMSGRILHGWALI